MQENNNAATKLSVSEVINEAIKLYKDNSKLFIKVSFYAFLVNFISSTISASQYFFKDLSTVVVYALFSFVISLVFMYFSIKLSIANYACVMERYRDRDIDVKGALGIASEKFWRYIGVNIQFFLIILVPIGGILASFLLVKDILLKCLMIGIFAIPLILLGTIFGFAPLMVILEKDKKQHFKVSKKLVEGDFWKVVFFTFVVMIAFSIPYYLYMYVFNDYKTIPWQNRYISSSLNQLLYVFVTPFTSSIYVVLYHKLKDNKRIG